METIPLKVFMASPSYQVTSMVDGGLTFFVGTGVVLLGLIALEKLGVPINEKMVRMSVLTGIVVMVLWTVLKNPLFRSMLLGF